MSKRKDESRAPTATHPSTRTAPGVFKRLIFSLVPLILLLGLGEGVARLISGDLKTNRYFYVAGGHEEYFGTRKLSIRYNVFPPYYWVPEPNTPITNNKGFRGHDWADVKPPGVVRIASLGDSCTLGGQESYSERLERLLHEALGNTKYEVLNGGVGSSSTYQMLQIFERELLPLNPDAVVLFLGWNDRWVHDGRRDSTHRLPTEWQENLRKWLSKSRLFQALVYFADSRRSQKVEQRVPANETAKNLKRLAKICRDRNLTLYLCTTPDGMPDQAIRSRFDDNKAQRDWDWQLYQLFKDKTDDPIAVWRYIQNLYCDTVRTVAKEESVQLIDLEQEVAERRALYKEPPLYFYKDGIHFTELGLQEVARTLALAITKDAEHAAVAAYIESAPYFATNAFIYANQFQFAAASDFLQKAEALGATPAGADALKERIAAERPFFDRYDAARMELSNRGDPKKVLAEYQVCLAMRPDDQDFRLDVADLAKGERNYQLALQTALGVKVDYTPQNLYRALWIGAESASALRDGNTTLQLLQQIARLFPQDVRARQILAQHGIH
ncbi:MAG: hypothetical protein J5I99_01675 [Verrucomicrobia bacterium]|nr:GDSL-type esterase/lipase family protein [Kiritimatiellia bacterium]MCO6399921.1 hypothetical protein [Verrucomicrobiota bacterium]